MPERDRLAAELPSAVARWLQGADPRTLQHVARDVAARVAARLLEGQGEAGWNRMLYELLKRDPSPAVSTVAQRLGFAMTAKCWTQKRVIAAVCNYLGLFGVAVLRDVAGRMSARVDFQHNAQPLAKSA